jgi:hypothetical protein
MQVVVVLLLIVAVVVVAWVAGLAWHRLSNRAANRALEDRDVAFCESCGVQQPSDASLCSACGSPLYISHLAGRRGG